MAAVPEELAESEEERPVVRKRLRKAVSDTERVTEPGSKKQRLMEALRGVQELRQKTAEDQVKQEPPRNEYQ